MIEKVKRLNVKIPDYIEVIISLIIIVAVIVGVINLVLQILNISFQEDLSIFFFKFLGDALNLIIGLELIKMLTGHSAYLVVEVLIYVIARLLVVNHPEALNMLLGVVSIAILFAVRKYLFIETDCKKKGSQASQDKKQAAI